MKRNFKLPTPLKELPLWKFQQQLDQRVVINVGDDYTLKGVATIRVWYDANGLHWQETFMGKGSEVRAKQRLVPGRYEVLHNEEPSGIYIVVESRTETVDNKYTGGKDPVERQYVVFYAHK